MFCILLWDLTPKLAECLTLSIPQYILKYTYIYIYLLAYSTSFKIIAKGHIYFQPKLSMIPLKAIHRPSFDGSASMPLFSWYESIMQRHFLGS